MSNANYLFSFIIIFSVCYSSFGLFTSSSIVAVLIVNGRKDLKSTIHRILDVFSDCIDYARGIFLKPNIVFPAKDKSGEITRLTFVKSLIAALRERHKELDIIIGEGVAAGCDPQENFLISGYAQLAHELNVPLLDLHTVERTTLSWKFGALNIPCLAMERTYISLPMLKPSSACVISGALKNQKGLLLPSDKKRFHKLGLHSQIAELNAVMRPSLSIMDCSLFSGKNTLISGNNCGEIDAAICRFLSIEEPEHVKQARVMQVFKDGYTVSGDNLKPNRITARLLAKEFKSFGRLRLWSNPNACSMCRYLFTEIQRHPLKRHSFEVGFKLFKYVIKGAEVIMGTNPNWRKEYDNVICIGECTRQIAKRNKYVHVPGCPPTKKDFLKYI